jgi:hypothetical protein
VSASIGYHVREQNGTHLKNDPICVNPLFSEIKSELKTLVLLRHRQILLDQGWAPMKPQFDAFMAD